MQFHNLGRHGGERSFLQVYIQAALLSNNQYSPSSVSKTIKRTSLACSRPHLGQALLLWIATKLKFNFPTYELAIHSFFPLTLLSGLCQ